MVQPRRLLCSVSHNTGSSESVPSVPRPRSLQRPTRLSGGLSLCSERPSLSHTKYPTEVYSLKEARVLHARASFADPTHAMRELAALWMMTGSTTSRNCIAITKAQFVITVAIKRHIYAAVTEHTQRSWNVRSGHGQTQCT
jgi:hypothetical protein